MPYGEEDAYKAQDILGGVETPFTLKSGNSPLFKYKLLGMVSRGVMGGVGGKNGNGNENILQQIANMIQGKADTAATQNPVADAGKTNVAANVAATGGTGNVPPHTHDDTGTQPGPPSGAFGAGGTRGSGGIGRNQLSNTDAAAMFGSDIRLKEKIQRTGASPSGIPIYEFNYIGDSNRYSGAMAQDLLEMNIDAVSMDESGYYKVNYNNIDVDMHLIN